MTTWIAALAAAVAIAGCGNSTPTSPTTYNLAPQGSLVLSGVVTGRSGSTSVPLAGVQIDATSGVNRRSAVSGDDGTFAIDGLSAGTWNLTARGTGVYESASFNVSVEQDTTVSVELVAPADEDPPNRPEPLKIRK
jgi:hypothetical protein